MSPSLSSWTIDVRAYQDSEQIAREAFSITITPYAYSASITATDAEGNEIGEESLSFSNNSEITFTAALSSEYEGKYSWVWEAIGGDSGKTHVLSSTTDSVELADVYALNSLEENWTLKAHAVDENNDQISSAGKLSFTIPYDGFYLAIDSNEMDGNYNYVGTGSTGSMSLGTALYARYKGSMPNGDSIDSYEPLWTVVALDEGSNEITGASFQLDCYFYDWEDQAYVAASDIRNAVGEEYATHPDWRIKLTLKNVDDSSEYTEGMASVDMYVPIVYSVDVTAEDGTGETYELDTTFSKNADITFEANLSPARDDVSYEWSIYGDAWYDEDNCFYDIEKSETGKTLSLADIVKYGTDETEWRIEVAACDDEGEEIAGYGFDLYLTLYDYNASMEVKVGEEVVEDFSEFTSSTDAVFTPSLDKEPEVEYSWAWSISGGYNGRNHEFSGDSITMAQLTALDTMENEWTIRAYAVDANGEQISSQAEVSFTIPYKGPFYVSFWAEGAENAPFIGMNNSIKNRGFNEGSYRYTKRGEPTGFAEAYEPRFMFYPISEAGEKLTAGAEVYPATDNGYDVWNSEDYRIGGGEFATGLTGEYTFENHMYWRLEMSIKDSEGNVYDADNDTDYMAAVNIDISNSLLLKIYADNFDTYYVGMDGVLEDNTDNTYFYPEHVGNLPAEYEIPHMYVTPIDKDGNEVKADGVPVQIAVTLDGSWYESRYSDCITKDKIHSAAEEANAKYLNYNTWRITHVLKNAEGEIYDDPSSADDIAALTVTFTAWEFPEDTSEYSMKLVDVATGMSYENFGTIEIPNDDRRLTLKAEMYLDGNLLTDNVTISWGWIGADTDNNPIQNPQGTMISGETYTFDDLLANANDNGLTISAAAFYEYTGDGDFTGSTDMQISVKFTEDTVVEPSPSGVKFYVNGEEYASGESVDIGVNETVTITAEGFGDFDGASISYTVDDEEVSGSPLTLSYAEKGTHTITATTAAMTRSLNADGTYTGTLTLNVTEEAAAPDGSGNSALMDMESEPTEFDVTGILQDDVTTHEPTVYSVEVIWGEMAFKYEWDVTTTKEWNSEKHEWTLVSTNNDKANGEWNLVTNKALDLPEGIASIYSKADQSYVVVANHSNAQVKVTMDNNDSAGNSYSVSSSLNAVTGGVEASTSTDAKHIYTLGRGEEDTMYADTSVTAAQIKLSDVPAENLSDDYDNPTTVATLTVTISKAD